MSLRAYIALYIGPKLGLIRWERLAGGRVLGSLGRSANLGKFLLHLLLVFLKHLMPAQAEINVVAAPPSSTFHRAHVFLNRRDRRHTSCSHAGPRRHGPAHRRPHPRSLPPMPPPSPAPSHRGAASGDDDRILARAALRGDHAASVVTTPRPGAATCGGNGVTPVGM
jgi:hypothetical protein